jgi:hypothetical protein
MADLGLGCAAVLLPDGSTGFAFLDADGNVVADPPQPEPGLEAAP